MFNFIDICWFSTGVVVQVVIPVHSISQGPIMLLRRSCQLLVFWVLFCRPLFVLLSFGHCVVCPSWIYGFRFLLWYLQTFLAHWILEYTFININVDIKNIFLLRHIVCIWSLSKNKVLLAKSINIQHKSVLIISIRCTV
jgi:hypothetical protein